MVRHNLMWRLRDNNPKCTAQSITSKLQVNATTCRKWACKSLNLKASKPKFKWGNIDETNVQSKSKCNTF
jgi:hypothetical protein